MGSRGDSFEEGGGENGGMGGVLFAEPIGECELQRRNKAESEVY